MHIGTFRSPLHTPEQAADFARTITRRPGFRLVGVMGYEGQIAGLGDAPPGRPVRAWMIRLIQGRSMPELVRRRTEAIRQIQAVASLESQIIPPSPDQGPTVSSAIRGAAAIRRYEHGQPRPLEAAPTSSLAYAPPPPPGGGPEVVQ